MPKEEGKVVIGCTVSVPCFDFTVDGRQLEKRTAIIAPIIVEETQMGTYKIGWACSRGAFCVDRVCRYARGSHWRRNYAEETCEE